MKRLLFSFLLVMAYLWAWADNTVTVTYNGNTATVSVDDNVAQYLTVTQSGAHVSITQGAVTDEITYTLTGTSNDGEFYMSGSYKATIELNGLSLTNATPVYSGAAVHIQNGKRINVKVITGTTNTLTDAASGSQKGCLYVKGHAEFKQYGTLNIVGNKSHGIKAGEYISIKNATININSAVDDGLSCNQYFLMESGTLNISGTGDDGMQCDLDGETSTGMTVNHEDEDSGNLYLSGGTITINCPGTAVKGIKSAGDVYISDNIVIEVTTTGNGMWDTTDQEAKASCGLDADGNITISGGTLTLIATGSGGKGMKCDNVLTISGGNTTVSTSGGLYYNNGSTQNLNYTGNIDNVNDNYLCAPKGVKAGTKTTSGYNTTYAGGIDISGGKISVTTTGNNAEGIESKNYLNVTGGEITVDAHDDGINAAQDLTITDGYVYARGSNNDGIDANGNVLIYGGLIYAIGANSPEVAIDANSEENKKFYFYGGTIIAIGGLERGSELNQTCYQASSWSSNTWYSLTYGSTVIAFRTPASGGSPLVVSTPSTPTVKSGVTVNSGTSIFEGKCYLDATCTGGSNVSLSQYTSGGGGNPPGPGGNTYTISASANPQAGGSVSGAGTYNRGDICTLIATANSGYTFTKWTKNGQQVSTNATYSFTVNGNASYVAYFTQQTTSYTITATANPTNGGTVTGAGTYTSGSTATLTATANNGYVFTSWTRNGSVVSTNASYSFTVTGNESYVANFSTIPSDPFTVTVVANNDNFGTVSGGGEYYYGTSCTVTATPADGYMFTNWTSNGNVVSSDAQYTFTVTSNVDLVANFSEGVMIGSGTSTSDFLPSYSWYKYALSEQIYTSAELGGAGLITSIAFYNGGATKTRTYDFYLKATTKNSFTGQTDWIAVSAGDKVFSGSVTMVADDWTTITFSTPFVYDGTSNVVLVADDNTGGYTQSPHMSCRVFTTTSNQALYYYDDSNNFNPMSPPTSSGSSSANVVLSSKNQLIITKEAISTEPVNITVSANPAYAGTVSGGGEYLFGEACTVSVIANTGYTFTGWTENGEVVSTELSFSFTAVADRDLVANFIQAIEIGTSATTHNYLPTYTYYNYSLTQQIYTAEEIGMAGTITSIAFYNEGTERTRTLDFYLKATTKDSFSSKTDWITMSASDKVFSGSVTMATNAWTFITFNTPFEYDGVSNLVLVTDDNTGGYESAMACSVYNTNTNQALYYWDDNNNFNPLAPPTQAGSSSWNNPNGLLSVKNHILMGIEIEELQVQQTIELSEGWNWVSTYIDMNAVDGMAMLQESLGDHATQIVTYDDSAEYFDGVWYWGSGEENKQLTNSEMIMVEVAEDCTVTLEGPVVGEVEITINPEWNWIGYPIDTELDFTEAMSDFDAEDEDSFMGFGATNDYFGEWYNTFETLVPGQGYMYYSNSLVPKTLVFHTGGSKARAKNAFPKAKPIGQQKPDNPIKTN